MRCIGSKCKKFFQSDDYASCTLNNTFIEVGDLCFVEDTITHKEIELFNVKILMSNIKDNQ
jgi:hypothetical protein